MISIGITDNFTSAFVSPVYAVKNPIGSSSFAAQLKAETDKAEIADKAYHSSDVCKKQDDPSLEEYKLSIYSKIFKISGRWRTSGVICSVFISDEGFKAMRSDPEYEEWVISQVKSACVGNRYGLKRKIYSVICIGETREDCRSESWTDIAPAKEEYEQLKEIRRKRLKLLKKLSLERYSKYRKALQENALKKSRMEVEHIKGNYDDMIYRMKNLSAESFVSKLFLFRL